MSPKSPADDDKTTEKILEKYLSSIYEKLDSLGGTFGAVAGVLIIVYLMQLVLEYSSSVHWLLAAVFSSIFVLLVIWYSRIARRTIVMSTRGVGTTYLMFGLTTAIVISGWVSYTMHTNGIGSYEVASAATLNEFMRLYFFTLADLIPALEIPETLHLSSPVETLDFTAGLPVLAFRVFVLWFVFDAFRTWRKRRKEMGKEKPGDLLLYGIFFITFIVVVLSDLR